MKKFFFVSLISGILFSYLSWASNMDCDVCGMKIEENAPNHFVLKGTDQNKEVLHVCSIPCAIKTRKNAPQYTKTKVADFNRPGKFLDGGKAFFLVKSKNIKKDLGDMVMPPYVIAFATKKEALAASQKQGDGIVVQGFDHVLKEVK